MKKLLETIMWLSLIVYIVFVFIMIGTTISEGNKIPVYTWIVSGALGLLSGAVLWVYEQGMKDASKPEVRKVVDKDSPISGKIP